ncbi:MAG: oligosaccharide flippase family protein, partial [Thermoanaerobaculia bacterium]
MTPRGEHARTIETVASAGVSAILTITYVVFVGRSLGPAESSDFFGALSLVYVWGVALSPITPTLARVVSRLRIREQMEAVGALRRATAGRIALWAGLIGAIGVACAPAVARALRFRSWLTVALALVIALIFVLLSVDRGVLQGLMRFREYNVNSVIESTIRCGGAVLVLGLVRRSALAALISYAVAAGVAEVLIAVRFRSQWRSAGRDRADWSEVLRLAGPMFILMVTIALFQNADVLALKRWFSSRDAGLYGAATALARGFGVVFVPLYVIAGPLLSELHERRQPLISRAVSLSAWFAGLSAIPLLAMIVWPGPVVVALYGPAFAGAAPLVAPLGGVAILMYVA